LRDRAAIKLVPVDERQAHLAREAWRDFGKGSGHPAKLNLGDCFASVFMGGWDNSPATCGRGQDPAMTDLVSRSESEYQLHGALDSLSSIPSTQRAMMVRSPVIATRSARAPAVNAPRSCSRPRKRAGVEEAESTVHHPAGVYDQVEPRIEEFWRQLQRRAIPRQAAAHCVHPEHTDPENPLVADRNIHRRAAVRKNEADLEDITKLPTV
jgi:hypothetical protein